MFSIYPFLDRLFLGTNTETCGCLSVFGLAAIEPRKAFVLLCRRTKSLLSKTCSHYIDHFFFCLRTGVMANINKLTVVLCRDLVYPLFIHDDSDETTAIASMPGCHRHRLSSMMKEVDESVKYYTSQYHSFFVFFVITLRTTLTVQTRYHGFYSIS